MLRQLAAIVAVTAIGAARAAAQPAPARARPAVVETPIPRVVEKSQLDIAPGPVAFSSLSVENPLGDVRIEGHDGPNVTIESHKTAPDDASIDRLRVSLVPGPDGALRLATAVDPGKDTRALAKSAVRVDLVIRAPRDLRFAARVGSGQLEVTGMDAGGEVDAVSGAVTLRNISGAIAARSITGPMSFSEIFGSIDAETLDAAMRLDTIAGDSLFASAHRGLINARRVRARQIEVITTTGDVDFEGELALRGQIMISSLRGNITVHLRGKGALGVRASGAKVEPGNTKTRVVKGVTLAEVGEGDERSTADLRSRHGVVAFAVNW